MTPFINIAVLEETGMDKVKAIEIEVECPRTKLILLDNLGKGLSAGEYNYHVRVPA